LFWSQSQTQTKCIKQTYITNSYPLRRDVILPIVANEKLAGDTLFFVAEADFTFHQEDDDKRRSFFSEDHFRSVWEDRLEVMQENMTEESREEFLDFTKEFFNDPAGPDLLKGVPRWRAWGNTSKVGGPAPDDPRWSQKYYTFVQQEGDPPRADGTRGVQYIRSKQMPGASSSKTITQELHDLLCLVNAAARVGRGGWTWLSWNAAHWSDATHRTTVPSTGGQLSAITTDAARWALARFREIHAQHTGTWMANVFLKEWQIQLGGSYASPPVGHYFEHLCSWDGKRYLKTHWHQHWCQSGTRPMKPGDVQRQICSWNDKGCCEPLVTVDVNRGDDLFWRTQTPPLLNGCWQGPLWFHLGEEDTSVFLKVLHMFDVG
jgi:hypothetical protein